MFGRSLISIIHLGTSKYVWKIGIEPIAHAASFDGNDADETVSFSGLMGIEVHRQERLVLSGIALPRWYKCHRPCGNGIAGQGQQKGFWFEVRFAVIHVALLAAIVASRLIEPIRPAGHLPGH